MLVSKIQTYLSDKIHLQKLLQINMPNWDLLQKWQVYL
jgi:hypothetical protein